MSEATGTPAMAPHLAEHAHPGPLEYIKVAVVLAVLTSIEVSVYYVRGLKGILAPLLIVMSIGKFALVGLYFMHLKFDTHLFRRLLVMGIILALIVYTVALTTLFHYH
jgi:caa(3)-type oxidase subunit IV